MKVSPKRKVRKTSPKRKVRKTSPKRKVRKTSPKRIKRKTSPKRKARKGNSKRLNPSPFTRYLNQFRNRFDIAATPWAGSRHQTGYLDQNPDLSYFSRNYTPGADANWHRVHPGGGDAFWQGVDSGIDPTEIDFDLDIDELEAEMEAERSRREINPCTRPGRYKCSECNGEQDPILLDGIKEGICADKQCYDVYSLHQALEHKSELPHNRQHMYAWKLRDIQSDPDEC